MIDDIVLWQSGVGFVALGTLLALELVLQRRGFVKPDGNGEEIT